MPHVPYPLSCLPLPSLRLPPSLSTPTLPGNVLPHLPCLHYLSVCLACSRCEVPASSATTSYLQPMVDRMEKFEHAMSQVMDTIETAPQQGFLPVYLFLGHLLPICLPPLKCNRSTLHMHTVLDYGALDFQAARNEGLRASRPLLQVPPPLAPPDISCYAGATPKSKEETWGMSGRGCFDSSADARICSRGRALWTSACMMCTSDSIS